MNRMLQWTWMTWAAGAGITALGCTPGSDDGESDTGDAPVEDTAAPEEIVPDLTITDEFTQDAFTAVNILWVIDPNWNALAEHRDALAAFYEQLLLHNVPWKVALMSSSAEPEEDRGELLNDHSAVYGLENMGVFYSVPGFNSPNSFRGVVEWTLTERLEEFQDFYFAGGHLSLISFTDRRDLSTTQLSSSYPEFLDFLAEQDVSRTVSVSAITVGDTEVREEWERYQEDTGGVVTSSVNPEVNLERVANASLGLTKSFELSEVPAIAPQTLVQTYRGNQRRLFIGEDYEFDFRTNEITLSGPAPFEGTRLTVRYQRRVEGLTNQNPDDQPDATPNGGTP
ncbi:MAG: hypothetical protein AAF602_07790 [Myxococcota bacterium]